MVQSTLKALAFMVAASFTLGACSFAGNNSVAGTCVGNCPDFSVNGKGDAQPWRSASTEHLPSGKDGPSPVEFSDSAVKTVTTPGAEKPQSCPFVWKSYGHDPWFDPTNKDPEGLSDAMDLIKKEMKLPDEVAKKLLELAKADSGTSGSLKKGDTLDVMVYGRGGKDKKKKLKRCVEVAFQEGASTREYVFVHENVKYILVKPERCVNWALRTAKTGGAS